MHRHCQAQRDEIGVLPDEIDALIRMPAKHRAGADFRPSCAQPFGGPMLADDGHVPDSEPDTAARNHLTWIKALPGRDC